jgi:hypothetical protein
VHAMAHARGGGSSAPAGGAGSAGGAPSQRGPRVMRRRSSITTMTAACTASVSTSRHCCALSRPTPMPHVRANSSWPLGPSRW